MVFASWFVGDFRGGEMGGICAKNPDFLDFLTTE
jgi:hypothetical protein